MNHLIVDGFGLMFRAMFAFKDLSTKSGLNSGAIYGFITLLRGVKKKYPDFRVTIVWDKNAQRKKDIFPGYKSDRPKRDIGESLTDLKMLFQSMDVTQAEMVGEEADDVIASVTSKYSSEEGLIYIYSYDKDLLQLVKNGKVIVIIPGPTDKFYDEEAVREKFGVSPENLSCYLSFRGDSVDSIPGVARVPSKIISELSEKYKTPEGVYSSGQINNLTEFQKLSFMSHQEQVKTNYRLVKLEENLNYTSIVGSPNEDVVKMILSKYEIQSISASSLVHVMGVNAPLQKKSPAIETYSLF